MLWGKPKILMVEDGIDNHPLFRDAFSSAGFEVIICSSAEDDFVGEVVSYKPDIISMDLMIAKEGIDSVLDGFEALELLKSDERIKKIPVIILTSFFQEDKVQKAKELGAVDFVNLQGQTLPNIAEQFMRCAKSPRRYKPSHPIFQEK